MTKDIPIKKTIWIFYWNNQHRCVGFHWKWCFYLRFFVLWTLSFTWFLY